MNLNVNPNMDPNVNPKVNLNQESLLERIRLLRERTGAGLMDCRQALQAAGGDVEQAVAALREKGFEAAARKAERVAAEGIVHAARFGSRAVLLEVNAETDFAAGNADFAASVARIAAVIAEHEPVDVPSLLDCPITGEEQTVGGLLQRMIMTFRENIVIRRFHVLAGPWPFAYMHQNGRIGVILTLDAPPATEWLPEQQSALERIGRELCLQIAAMAPRFVARNRLAPEALTAIESQVETELADDPQLTGKPKAIRERIARGRLEKHLKTFGLMDQAYMRDDAMTVQAWLEQTTAGWPFPVAVAAFDRFARGEGLTNGHEPSAVEYARQLSGAASR